MKERPILFSGEMVRAILCGTKTQTRRVINRFNSHFGSAGKLFFDHCAMDQARVDGTAASGQYLHVPCHVADDGCCAVCDKYGWPGTIHRLYPNWDVGDRLWVRENGWERPERTQRMMRDGADTWPAYEYDADGCDHEELNGWGWIRRPSIHMPRWASRITLEITGVRVERVNDISEEDARREGYNWKNNPETADYEEHARPWFASLWNAINERRSRGFDLNDWWEINDLVWVREFKRLHL